MANLQTYGKPSIITNILRMTQKKIWYRVYAPIPKETHEEEQ